MERGNSEHWHPSYLNGRPFQSCISVISSIQVNCAFPDRFRCDSKNMESKYGFFQVSLQWTIQWTLCWSHRHCRESEPPTSSNTRYQISESFQSSFSHLVPAWSCPAVSDFPQPLYQSCCHEPCSNRPLENWLYIFLWQFLCIKKFIYIRTYIYMHTHTHIHAECIWIIIKDQMKLGGIWRCGSKQQNSSNVCFTHSDINESLI